MLVGGLQHIRKELCFSRNGRGASAGKVYVPEVRICHHKKLYGRDRGPRRVVTVSAWPPEIVSAVGGNMGLPFGQLASPISSVSCNEVWENQSRFGFIWQGPAFFDRAPWTDPEGNPVDFEHAPREDDPGDWELVITEATDDDGWLYATQFSRIDSPRPGGRSSQRFKDFVRRRKWRRRGGAMRGSVAADEAAAAEAEAEAAAEALRTLVPPSSAMASPATVMQASRVRRQAEAERRSAAARMFVDLITSTVRRRTLFSLLPLDPTAWLALLQRHQQDFAALLASQMDHTLPLPPPGQCPPPASAPPSADEGREQAPLLEDMTYATIHSRAAYGYAMLAGHMSTVYSYAMLQTVHRLDFSAAGGASGEANNEAVLALTGLRPGSLLMAEWANSVSRPCHYVAVDHANRRIVLSIRGSLEVGDMLSNLSANPMEVWLLGCSGRAHTGMMEAATFVRSNTHAALEQAARLYPGWPLFITGHSLGGGVGAILATLLHHYGKPEGLGDVVCYAVGPAAVFTAELAETVAPFVTSVVLRADVVPRLSYASVEDAFLELVHISPVRSAAQNLGRIVNETLEGLTAPLMANLRHPVLVRAGSGMKSGLGALAQLAEDAAAASRAARTAQGALAAAEIEMSALPSTREQAQGVGPSSAEEEASQDMETDTSTSSSRWSQLPSGDEVGDAVISRSTAKGAMERLRQLSNSVPAREAKPVQWPQIIPTWHQLNSPEPAAGSPQAGQGTIDEDAQFSGDMAGTQLPLERASHSADASNADAHAPVPQGAGHAEGIDAGGRVSEEAAPAETEARREGVPVEVAVAEPGRSADGGMGGGPSAERQAAAEALGAPDRQGGVEHPEPLYVAGRVLWLVPASNGGDDAGREGESNGEEEMMSMSVTSQGEPVPSLAGSAPSSATNTAEGPPPGGEGSQGGGPGGAAEEAKQGLKVLEVGRSCFGRILLVPDMIVDHLPDAYLKALQVRGPAGTSAE